MGGVQVALEATDGSGESGTTTTASDGTYTVSGLAPNSYTVEFDPVGQDYVDQFYNDETEIGSADTINVAAGSTQNGIDATLAAGASISGTVTDGGGSQLGGIEVHVVATDGSGNGGTTFAGSDGTYSVGGGEAAGRQLLGGVRPRRTGLP